MGGAGCLCLSSSISPWSGGLQGSRPRLPTDDSDCPRMARHALVLGSVNMLVQVSLLLPQVENLLTQPSASALTDIFNLNLHALRLEPRAYNSKGSLKKWQKELKLLRDAQPEVSTSLSGPCLSNGVSQIWWTSGHLQSKLWTSSCTCFRRKVFNLV